MENGGGRGAQSVHRWLRVNAMCVVCPRDSSAATPHVCLAKKRGSLSSPPSEAVSNGGCLMLLPWRWGVLVIGTDTYSQV